MGESSTHGNTQYNAQSVTLYLTRRSGQTPAGSAFEFFVVLIYEAKRGIERERETDRQRREEEGRERARERLITHMPKKTMDTLQHW